MRFLDWILRKKYIVHRCGMKDGGTQHWFSPLISKRQAKKLSKNWRDIDYIPTQSESDNTGVADLKDFTIDSLKFLHIEEK